MSLVKEGYEYLSYMTIAPMLALKSLTFLNPTALICELSASGESGENLFQGANEGVKL